LSTRCGSAICLFEIVDRPSCAPILSFEVPGILAACCRGLAAAFASKPARQIVDRVASPQVQRKIAVALYYAWRKFRSLSDPAFSP
jgi:hypothetical protein